jgi:hypothetical protein
MNDLQFAGGYKFLVIRCSGRLISLQHEHPIYSRVHFEILTVVILKNTLLYFVKPCSSDRSNVSEKHTASIFKEEQ